MARHRGGGEHGGVGHVALSLRVRVQDEVCVVIGRGELTSLQTRPVNYQPVKVWTYVSLSCSHSSPGKLWFAFIPILFQ